MTDISLRPSSAAFDIERAPLKGATDAFFRPSTVIFDFDGTLHDSMYIYERAFNFGYSVLADAGKVEPHVFTPEEIRGNIGVTAREAWSHIAPNLPWSEAKVGADSVGVEMRRLMATGQARLYPGVREMLSDVKSIGLTLVFLSNCAHDYMMVAREAFGLDEWFSGYYSAEDYGWIPKQQIFDTISQEFDGPFVAVGDRFKDIELAVAHNLPCIGCTYGFGTREELAPATYLADSPAEVAPALARIESSR